MSFNSFPGETNLAGINYDKKPYVDPEGQHVDIFAEGNEGASEHYVLSNMTRDDLRVTVDAASPQILKSRKSVVELGLEEMALKLKDDVDHALEHSGEPLPMWLVEQDFFDYIQQQAPSYLTSCLLGTLQGSRMMVRPQRDERIDDQIDRLDFSRPTVEQRRQISLGY